MKTYEEWSCKSRELYNYDLGENDSRRWYQRDIDQITHSTAFRKLQHKSQLLSEKDPRSRSRLIHTIEVSRIATEISEKLNVSKELTEAISFAHDIATAPFGYIGNNYLKDKVESDFSHESSGVFQLLNLSKKRYENENIIEKIEKNLEAGKRAIDNKIQIGNSGFQFHTSTVIRNKGKDDEQVEYYVHHISPEIVDGVLNHGAKGVPQTLEGQVVQVADNIAYLSQDIEDLLLTKIIKENDFTRCAARTLKYIRDGKEYDEKWEMIENPKWGSLKDAFSKTRGRRVAALINRFVCYNLDLLENNELEYRYSEILDKKIPILKIDPGMETVINFIWQFIEAKYNDPLILTSNDLQKQKMEELWIILDDERFKTKNSSYQKFMSEISRNSLYSDFDIRWKKAFFISHLSYNEVDLIIDSFHERNFTFDIDIEEA